MFGPMVALQAAVAIQMIRRQVEHAGHRQAQFAGALKLKTRQLQHIQLDPIVQHIQRRRTQVAAHGDPTSGPAGHGADQFRDRGLGVGAGDADDRRPGRRHKQIDVTAQRGARLERAAQPGLVHGDTGRHNQLPRGVQHGLGDRTREHGRRGQLGAQRVQGRRVRTGIDEHKFLAARGEETGRGETGRAQPHDHLAPGAADQGAHVNRHPISAASGSPDRTAPASR